MSALYRSSARRPAAGPAGRACTVTTARRWALTAACAGAAAVVLVGCGSSSSSSSSSTGTSAPAATGTPAVCTQAGELQASLRQLTSINVVQQGTNGVKAAADNVQTQLDNLKQSASDQYRSQVDALQTAVSDLENVVSNLGSQSSPVTAVVNAVGQVGTTAKALTDAISSSCPGGIPSVSASPQSSAS